MNFVMPLTTPHLAAALRDAETGSPEARWVAAQSLASIDGDDRVQAVDALYRLLNDPVQEVRAQAVEALAEQMRAGASISVEKLTETLHDPSGEVRCAAIDAAAQIPGDFETPIASALLDKDPSVRATAASALGELGAADTADQIARLLQDTTRFVQINAAMALAALGDPRSIPVLLSLLRSDSGDADAAVVCLGELGHREASPPLHTLANRFFVPAALKALTAAAMVRCHHAKGIEILNTMLGSRFKNTRMAALNALARLPISDMAASVGPLLEKSDPVEVSSAIQTFRILTPFDPDACRNELQIRAGKLPSQELNGELDEALAACNSR